MGLQLILLLLCLAGWLISWIPNFESASYLSALAGSIFSIKEAITSLKARQLDVNFLMLLAAAGAIAIGQPRDAASLFFLFALSNWLEARTMAKTSGAIGELMKLRPEVVTKIISDKRVVTKLSEIQLNDELSIAAFENIAFDGIIVSGTTSIDESSLTGESVPVYKEMGEIVSAGTQNLEGSIHIRVTQTLGSTSLDRIVTLIQQAQENKASGEKISSWFGQTYTYLVIASFLISFAIRLTIKQPMQEALYASIVLLVGLSPCALVISTPAATLSALTRAARKGILVRGGEYIEKAAQIDIVTMDKTGTITEGKPKLLLASEGTNNQVTIDCSAKVLPENLKNALRMVASVEARSSHPIAKAFVNLANLHQLDIITPANEITHPGLGIEAKFQTSNSQETWWVGNDSMIQVAGFAIPVSIQNQSDNFKSDGLTTVFASNGNDFWLFALGDAVRKEAGTVIQELESLGVKQIQMLTGDKQQTGEKIAASVGIKTIRGNLMPADKISIVQELGKEGEVMMVGDGVNDAPALTAATIGVAMGGLGSDIALNSADVVLMKDRLSAIPELIQLGRRTNRIIKANMTIAIGMMILLALLSFLVKLPLPLAVLGHEGSTVLVILNGLRLLRD